MDFEQLMLHRQSCRNYNPEKAVPHEELAACVAAARLAPSACNALPWHMTVCTGAAAAAVAEATRGMGMNKFTEKVPAMVVVTEDAYNASAAAGSRMKHQDYRSVDIGLATAYFTLAATERGLSTCILGWFNEEKLQEMLGTKARVRLVLAVGYAAEGDPLRPKTRKDVAQLADYKETV